MARGCTRTAKRRNQGESIGYMLYHSAAELRSTFKMEYGSNAAEHPSPKKLLLSGSPKKTAGACAAFWSELAKLRTNVHESHDDLSIYDGCSWAV